MVDLNPVEEPMLDDGRTALHYAASTGDSSSVAELLAAGSVNANAQDAVGYSAVQIAAAEGHLDVLRLLLRHDANVNLHDNLVSSSRGISVSIGRDFVQLMRSTFAGFLVTLYTALAEYISIYCVR